MKSFFIMALSLTLILSIFSINPLKIDPAQAQEYQSSTIDNFHERLDTVFKQSDEDTLTQQIIYSSIEAVGFYKLGTFITKPNKKEILFLASEIKALENNSGEMPNTQREAKIRQLKRKMAAIEGNIFKRMGRGVVKLLARSGQLFLILDIGSRIYVLNTLNEKDPGFIPSYTILCSQVDCQYAVEQVIDAGNRAYIEARNRF